MQHVSASEILWLNADTSKGDEAMSPCDCFWKLRLLSILICGMGDSRALLVLPAIGLFLRPLFWRSLLLEKSIQ